MAKCIFDKKANLKGYRQCAITNQYKRDECYGSRYTKPCKHFKMSFWNKFLYWLDLI